LWYFANNQNIKVVIMELYRNIIEELKTWKRNPGRKPLILKGARQTGKTWILEYFGRTEYEFT